MAAEPGTRPRSHAQRVTLLVVSLCAGLALHGGTAAATTEARDSRVYQLESFDRVYLHGNARLHLVQGTPGPVTATGSTLSLDRLVFESADDALYIDAGEGQTAEQLVIRLSVSQLKEVVNDGRGEVLADGLTSAALALEGRGAGRFDLRDLEVEDLTVIGEGQAAFEVSGVAENQFVDLAGLGSYNAQGLSSQTSQVSVRGAGQVDLWVERLLDVNVFGTARVRYSGAPRVLQQIFGSGAIDRMP